MENEKMESLLIDYIDGVLPEADMNEVTKLLAEDKKANQLYLELKLVMETLDKTESFDLSPGHSKVFEHNLSKVMASQTRYKTFFLRPVIYRAAAAIALVMLGLAGGYWLNQNNQHQKELAALRKEMMETKQMMMAMLNNDQSASQRMRGVNVALNISKPDDEIVKALANAMMTDPNTNVRLAALEALGQFTHEEYIKKILVSSLANQDDPMVQIALIQLLVSIKEKGVINDLERIIEDDKAMKAVKDEAYTGLLKLS